MTVDVFLVIVLLTSVYLLGGTLSTEFCPLNDLFENPLHKIWMVLLWPLTIVIWMVYSIYLVLKDYIDEVKDYYQEKKKRRKRTMETTDGLKEVWFDIYCETCRHKGVAEEEEPCCTCLDEPVNQNSHKPVKWEEK